MGPFASMDKHVFVTRTALGESFVTVRALVRLFARVCAHMAGQIGAVTESLVTLRTLEGFLASMNP